MLTGAQTRAWDRMTRVAERRGSVGTTYVVNVSAPNYVGSPRDLINAMSAAAGRGELDGVLRKAGVKR